MTHHQLHAERIGGLFQAVDAGLSGTGLRSPVEIVGGAAIALLWNPRRSTYDVDVVSEGVSSVFWDVVAVIGRGERLEDGWLNAAARIRAPTGTMPGESSAGCLGSNVRGVRGECPLRAWRAQHGWEVATTDPDGSLRQLSGRHPTAEAARDLRVWLANVHPRLHIPGWDPQRSAGSGCGFLRPPPTREQAPTDWWLPLGLSEPSDPARCRSGRGVGPGCRTRWAGQ